MGDILNFEGDPSSTLLNINYLIKDIKKTLYLEFNNEYEKYFFKTIVFNHLVLNYF